MTLQQTIPPGAERMERHRLGMAECGWRGIAEGWLLKRLGDIHWQMIAEALGQQTAVFHDATGAPVYAAFCAIAERFHAPALPAPGQSLVIGSRLWRLSAARLISIHRLAVGPQGFGDVTMISAFVRHGADGQNRSILRSQPVGELRLPPLPPGADGGFAARAAAMARSTDPGVMPDCGPDCGPDVVQLLPCPMTDFNAAGLLYCANYSALADRAEWALRPGLAPLHLIARETVFMGNVDPGIAVQAALRPCPGARPQTHEVTLRAQGRVLARIRTVKAGAGQLPVD